MLVFFFFSVFQSGLVPGSKKKRQRGGWTRNIKVKGPPAGFSFSFFSSSSSYSISWLFLRTCSSIVPGLLFFLLLGAFSLTVPDSAHTRRSLHYLKHVRCIYIYIYSRRAPVKRKGRREDDDGMPEKKKKHGGAKQRSLE